MTDLIASASYFLAAIAAATDHAVAEDTMNAIADVLPYHLRDDLRAAWS
jgi:hypothetical protein